MKGKRKSRFAVWLIALLLVAAGVYLYAGWIGYQEAPKLIQVNNAPGQLKEPYQLSSQQQEVLFSHGYPQGFTILFYEEERSAGEIQTVRLETWDYYTQGVGYTFINGEKTAEDALEGEYTGSLQTLPYYPEQFGAFMSLEEVLAATGIESYVEVPLQKEFLEGGASYFANGLTFGLKDDELLYIEALAVSSK